MHGGNVQKGKIMNGKLDLTIVQKDKDVHFAQAIDQAKAIILKLDFLKFLKNGTQLEIQIIPKTILLYLVLKRGGNVKSMMTTSGQPQ